MAVVRAPHVLLKPELWESCFNLPPEPYAFSMPYQHITPPPSQAASNTPQPALGSTYSVPSQDHSVVEGDGKDSDESHEEQSANVALRRSFSTPNTAQIQQQGAQDTQSQPGTAGEKKRNKLGYHRTSIACSHCRRRKIRCIASPDVQNRCINCIRLKKECSFYPVDQQPGAESRPRASARQTAGTSVTSTTTSPAVAAGSPGEMQSHHPHPPASGATQGNKVQTAGDEYYPPDVKVPSNGIPSGQYGFADQASTPWIKTEGDLAPMSKAEAINMSWQPYAAESPMSTQFSPYTQSSTAASATWASGNSEAESHDDGAWPEFPPPVRSMSLSGESTGGQQHLSYLTMSQGHPFERRPSALGEMYTHSFGTPVANLAPSSMAGMESQGPLVSGIVPSNAEAWQHQVLSQGQNPYAKQATTSMFEDWQNEKARGSAHVWLEDQLSQSTVTLTPSEAYYSS